MISFALSLTHSVRPAFCGRLLPRVEKEKSGCEAASGGAEDHCAVSGCSDDSTPDVTLGQRKNPKDFPLMRFFNPGSEPPAWLLQRFEFSDKPSFSGAGFKKRSQPCSDLNFWRRPSHCDAVDHYDSREVAA